MSKTGLAAVICFAVCATAGAAEAERPESKTFADILARVTDRDMDSGAILYVKMKEDAPQCCGGRLEFEMSEQPAAGYVVVTLRTQTITDDIYERYRLNIDKSIRQELDKLALMKKQQAEKAKRLAEDRAEKIKKATGGKLKYGMTRGEVVAVLGEPKKVDEGFMEAGRFSLEYDQYKLEFRITLFDLEEAK
jgi:hypothetical protein